MRWHISVELKKMALHLAIVKGYKYKKIQSITGISERTTQCIWALHPHSSAKYVRCTRKIPCATLPMLLWKPTWANQLKIWHCCQVGPLWKICQLLHMRSINHLYECLVGLILQWKHYYIDIQKHLMWLSLKAIVLSNVLKWPSISLQDAADAIEMAQHHSKWAFTMAWNWPTCQTMCCWWPRVASNWCCQ